MNKPDVFRVTFDQNPTMAEVVKEKKPGDKMELEVHTTLKATDAEGADFTIEAVVPEGYELDENADEAPGSPVSSEAMMTPAAMAVRKKKQE